MKAKKKKKNEKPAYKRTHRGKKKIGNQNAHTIARPWHTREIVCCGERENKMEIGGKDNAKLLSCRGFQSKNTHGAPKISILFNGSSSSSNNTSQRLSMLSVWRPWMCGVEKHRSKTGKRERTTRATATTTTTTTTIKYSPRPMHYVSN